MLEFLLTGILSIESGVGGLSRTWVGARWSFVRWSATVFRSVGRRWSSVRSARRKLPFKLFHQPFPWSPRKNVKGIIAGSAMVFRSAANRHLVVSTLQHLVEKTLGKDRW